MTKVVYATRSGNVESIIKQLGITDALKIETGQETIDGDYVLFTYNTGQGAIPKTVATFLENNPGIKAVIGSGSMARHADTFNGAVDAIVERYQVPALAKLDGQGTPEDIVSLKTALADY